MQKAKEVIRITEKQKRFLESLKVNKSQHYHEVLNNIIEDYKIFKKRETRR
jgi:hypothetical protein